MLSLTYCSNIEPPIKLPQIIFFDSLSQCHSQSHTVNALCSHTSQSSIVQIDVGSARALCLK